MSDSADRVRDLLEHISDALGLDAEVVVEEDGRNIRGVLEGDDLGLFIGRHGSTIEAVQHLAQRVVMKDHDRAAPRKRIVCGTCSSTSATRSRSTPT
jgi:spoIIIJ-associated protein